MSMITRIGFSTRTLNSNIRAINGQVFRQPKEWSRLQRLGDSILNIIDGYKPVVTRIDDHDAAIKYTGDWYRTVPDGYVHFNRTISRASVTEEDTSEKSFEFELSDT